LGKDSGYFSSIESFRDTPKTAAHYAIANEKTSKSGNEIMSTVLVVEDSVTQREMISDLLKGSGLSVTVASDGVEALEQIQGKRPDLVVLDIVMPRMNGYEVCRRLKADPKTQNVPVVMCSSKGEEFDRYWGMKQGADAYIAKPFQPKELIGTVKQLLRG
jgi:twitching motility two-component system response regulator PilH